MSRATFWILSIGVMLAIISCIGVWIPGIDIAFFLAFGWIPFLNRASHQITVRWDLVLSTLAYVAVLFVGLHLFIRWLHRELYIAGDGGSSRPPWCWRATLGLLTLVLVLFAAGTAIVGIAHQTAWLIRSPEPIYRLGSSRARRILCASNLKQISLALSEYASKHDGRFPDDLSELARSVDVGSVIFTCPSSESHVDAEPTSPEQLADLLRTPEHCSFVYLGKGLAEPIDPARPVAVDLWDNHQGDGVNVLMMDGVVQWMDRPKAEQFLLSLGFEKQPKSASPR